MRDVTFHWHTANIPVRNVQYVTALDGFREGSGGPGSPSNPKYDNPQAYC